MRCGVLQGSCCTGTCSQWGGCARPPSAADPEWSTSRPRTAQTSPSGSRCRLSGRCHAPCRAQNLLDPSQLVFRRHDQHGCLDLHSRHHSWFVSCRRVLITTRMLEPRRRLAVDVSRKKWSDTFTFVLAEQEQSKSLGTLACKHTVHWLCASACCIQLLNLTSSQSPVPTVHPSHGSHRCFVIP